MARTRTLIRLILRRDRFLMPIWIAIVPLTLIIQPSATEQLFPTPDKLEIYAKTLRTPALVALYGPVFDSNLGALSVTRAGIAPVILALIAALTVIRHTRTEEEAGRRELIGSAPVGRHAPLAAATIATCGACLVVGVVVTAGLIGQDLPVAGSVAAGVAYAVVGCMFAAVGAVAAQVTQSPGAARGIALGVLGVAFVLRLAGDVGTGALSRLSWFSPIGWGQQIRPFAAERWWVLGLAAALLAAGVAIAGALSSRRDVGAGLIPPRPGPPAGSPRLRSPLALAWRLQRPALLGWAFGVAGLGLVLGGSAGAIEDLVEESPELEEIFLRMGGQAALTDAYLAAVMGLLALIASGYAIQAALRMRSEESALRAEWVLATPVARLRWAVSHLVFAVFGPIVVLTVGGVGTGLVHGLATGDVGGELPRILAGAIVRLPAVWVTAAIATTAFGILPHLASAVSWGSFGFFVLVGQFGPALRVEQWVLNLSPYTHAPNMPGGVLRATPLLALALVAAGTMTLGLRGFRVRDLAGA